MSRTTLASVALFALVIGLVQFADEAPAQAAPASATPLQLLTELSERTPSNVPYDRSRFAEGIDADSNGCNTRREVLIAESIVPVTMTGTCDIVAGEWYSWYDGVTWTDPSQVQMDHVVALKEAWVSGAHGWTDQQRSDYANDLVIDETLAMVTGSVNGSKSHYDPAQWLPPLQSAHCDYASDWITVKYRWQLSVDAAEKAALTSVLATCGSVSIPVPPVRTDVSTAASTVNALPAGTHRLAGTNRYLTAVAISSRFNPGVPVVYIATGTDYPDALSASALAAAAGGPLLLVQPTSIPAPVAAELRRLAPEKIIIAGGTSVVSTAVEKALKSIAPVERAAGGNRYATSRQLALSAGTLGPTAFVATGRNFPDALSATAAAGSLGGPVVLVDGGSSTLDAATASTLVSLGTSSVKIAGGTGVVSSGIESSLRSRFGNVQRYGGGNRFVTGTAINTSTFSSPSTVYLAVGDSFADALAGGALAGATGSPLFIVQKNCVPAPVRNAILNWNPSTIVLLGGTGVLGSGVASLTECSTAAPPKPPSKPSNPGDTKNCSDFKTWSEAQAWFNKYYPYYGDIARLDANNDLIACESLPGSPSR